MRGRPFSKGQSGNPGGRKKLDPKVGELAREYTVEAIMKLVTIMRSDDGRAAVLAANAILDRGHGKPKQAIQSEVEHRFVAEIPLAQLTVDEWKQLNKPQT